MFAALAMLALFSAPLNTLLRLSLSDDRYTHIVVIPLISLCLVYGKRKRIFADKSWCPSLGLPLLLLGWVLYVASNSHSLSLEAFAIVVTCMAGFILCYGIRPFKTARFPLLVLLLAVPIPSAVMESIIFGLQTGSADISHTFFNAAGIPVFRHGFLLELPNVGIEIARECSSIHSGWALFITGLLVGHVFLRSLWSKVCLSFLTLPIAVFTNAIRIVTIWFLGTHIDVAFLDGDLHHHGGILFSLISLSLLLAFLLLLKKFESRPPSGLPVAVLVQDFPGGQPSTPCVRT